MGSRVRRDVWRECGTDIAHKVDGGRLWRSDSQDPGMVAEGVVEAVPLPLGRDKHRPETRLAHLGIPKGLLRSANWLAPAAGREELAGLALPQHHDGDQADEPDQGVDCLDGVDAWPADGRDEHQCVDAE
jgi:hypothetical protein